MTKITQHKITTDDIEEILDLAIELASEDPDELNAAEEFQLLGLNHCEKHYVQKALDQLQTQGKNIVDTATAVL